MYHTHENKTQTISAPLNIRSEKSVTGKNYLNLKLSEKNVHQNQIEFEEENSIEKLIYAQ